MQMCSLDGACVETDLKLPDFSVLRIEKKILYIFSNLYSVRSQRPFILRVVISLRRTSESLSRRRYGAAIAN